MSFTGILKRTTWTFINMWGSPLKAFLSSLVIYLVIAISRGDNWWVTQNNYYNYLADALLHGQFHLRLIPLNTHDLVLYQGKYFLYWPPFPAILLTPFVLLFGPDLSGVLVTVLIGSLNVGLVAKLLRQVDSKQVVKVKDIDRSLLVIFFALGSVHLPLVPFGNVWATGQLVAFLFIVLAYILALSLSEWKAFFFTGLALTCAMLTRSHTIFVGIWLIYFLIKSNWQSGWKRLVFYCIIGVTPIFIGGVLYLAYNFYRFGNPLEIGLDFHLMAPFFQSDYAKYGPFNTHYIPINIYYQYIYYPFPWTTESFMGGSLFLLIPLLFSIFWGMWKGKPRLSVFFLVLSIIISNIPIIILMGTGWIQIGPRYTLDFTIPLLILAAIGIKYWKTPVSVILVSISCFHYLTGVSILLNVMR